MPLWLIFHPDGTFEDDASKQALSTDITNIYTGTAGLPAFYVVVNFIKMPSNSVWIGGAKPTKPFIRVVIDHIAVTLPDKDEVYRNMANKIDETLRPHVLDKGYDCEFHVDETERRLWKINGLFPPAHGSAEERRWVKENRAVAVEGKL